MKNWENKLVFILWFEWFVSFKVKRDWQGQGLWCVWNWLIRIYISVLIDMPYNCIMNLSYVKKTSAVQKDRFVTHGNKNNTVVRWPKIIVCW